MPSTSNDNDISKGDLLRYGRHLVLPEVGAKGQKKIRDARVLIVGAGGLGSPAALYLAAAGIGTLGLVDDDQVEISNLQRQILHDSHSVGISKLESASKRIHDLNPDVKVRTHKARLTSHNALDIVGEYDIVIDGTDNLPTRYLLNDTCVFLKKPNVYGSVYRFEGQVSLLDATKGPCYRCLYPDPPPPELVPSCAEGGVLGVLPGIIGTIQATEALKFILGVGDLLIGRILMLDALKLRFEETKLNKDPSCVVCGKHPTITALIDYDEFCGLKKEEEETEISVQELKKRLDAGKNVFLLDVREPFELQIATIGGHLIPLGQLPQRMKELDPSKEIVVYCRTGGRSGRAVEQLRRAGFRKAKNLVGGIAAWSNEIDSTIPTY